MKEGAGWEVDRPLGVLSLERSGGNSAELLPMPAVSKGQASSLNPCLILSM